MVSPSASHSHSNHHGLPGLFNVRCAAINIIHSLLASNSPAPSWPWPYLSLTIELGGCPGLGRMPVCCCLVGPTLPPCSRNRSAQKLMGSCCKLPTVLAPHNPILESLPSLPAITRGHHPPLCMHILPNGACPCRAHIERKQYVATVGTAYSCNSSCRRGK